VNLRTVLVPAALAALALTGCGGGDDDTAAEPAVEAGGPTQAGAAAEATLATLTGAIEGAGYSCSPAEFTLTPSVGAGCLAGSSVLVSAFAWEDDATADQFAPVENGCTVDSGLGELMTLEDENWAIRAAVFGTPTADRLDDITAALESFQAALGGEIVSTPCA
jgi:hypothetical protein